MKSFHTYGDIMDNKEYLRAKCFEGLEKRGFIEDFNYVKRLNYELDVIYSGDLEEYTPEVR